MGMCKYIDSSSIAAMWTDNPGVFLFADKENEIGRKRFNIKENRCFPKEILSSVESRKNLKCLLCLGLAADCQTVHETKKGANQPQHPPQTPQLYPATSVL